MNDHIRRLADGRYRARREVLRVALIQQLASIDHDYINRRMYNTSARLCERRVAQRESLRQVMEARVHSVVEAYETAGTPFDTEGQRYVLGELQQLHAERRDELTADAAAEADKSQLGDFVKQGAVSAIGRDLGIVYGQVADVLQTEIARQALLHARVAKQGETQPEPAVPASFKPVVPPSDGEESGPGSGIDVSHSGVEVAMQGDVRPAASPPVPVVQVRQPNGPVTYESLMLELVNPDRPSTTALRISYGQDAAGRVRTVILRGRTVAHLAKLVIEQPDRDHKWSELVGSGNLAGYWKLLNTAALKRAGQRIKKSLPAQLKGHWNQSESQVCWQRQ
jgi:hypothetical protein